MIYYNENSPYIRNMREIYNKDIYKLNNSHSDAERSEIAKIISVLKRSFTMYKPIHGEYERRRECGNNYYFYNEREWRFLLSESTAYLQSKYLPQFIIDFYNGVEEGEKWKPGILELNNQIKFTYDDIDFVIIPSTCDKEEIVEKLKVSQNDIDKIKDRITTLETLMAQKI